MNYWYKHQQDTSMSERLPELIMTMNEKSDSDIYWYNTYIIFPLLLIKYIGRIYNGNNFKNTLVDFIENTKVKVI